MVPDGAAAEYQSGARGTSMSPSSGSTSSSPSSSSTYSSSLSYVDYAALNATDDPITRALLDVNPITRALLDDGNVGVVQDSQLAHKITSAPHQNHSYSLAPTLPDNDTTAPAIPFIPSNPMATVNPINPAVSEILLDSSSPMTTPTLQNSAQITPNYTPISDVCII